MKNKLFLIILLSLKYIVGICQSNNTIDALNIVSGEDTMLIGVTPDNSLYIKSKNNHNILPFPFADNNNFKNAQFIKSYYYDTLETIGYSIPIKSESYLTTSELFRLTQKSATQTTTALSNREKYRYGYPTLSLLICSYTSENNAAIIICKNINNNWVMYDSLAFVLPDVNCNANFLSKEAIYVEYKKNGVTVEQVGLIDMAGVFNWFYEPSEKDSIIYPFEKK
jgi:hypothetical protein